jgi:hypothetical protein
MSFIQIGSNDVLICTNAIMVIGELLNYGVLMLELMM